MPLISPAYCSESQVERYLSSQGVIDFADHDEDGTANVEVVNDCINQATEEMDLYLRQRYTQDILGTSKLVERWATVLAARFLCQRRGNPVPASLEGEYERIANPDGGLLARIADGSRQLPGLALREDLRPTMSNVDIDRRYQRSTVRVSRQNSSDAPTKLTQDQSIDYPQRYD